MQVCGVYVDNKLWVDGLVGTIIIDTIDGGWGATCPKYPKYTLCRKVGLAREARLASDGSRSHAHASGRVGKDSRDASQVDKLKSSEAKFSS